MANLSPDSASNEIAVTVKAALAKRDLIDATTPMRQLSGGRTNRIWALGPADDALICKLFRPDGGTALFPNDVDAEISALRHLAGTGVAPEFVDVFTTKFGTCLIYRMVEGHPWKAGEIGAIARTTRILHQIAPPEGMREVAMGAKAILAMGDDMLAGCEPAFAAQVRAYRPNPDPVAKANPVFLHGDLVPANVVCCPGNIPVLIDWQCPAVGDACEDLSTFLSPAMQSLYGSGPLSTDQEDAFLQAYDDRDVADRLKTLRPHFHYRMAAHCLWKVENGAPDYKAALKLELAALDQQPHHDS